MIEMDGDLRSLACYCYGMKIATVEIKVNVCMSSMSSCSGASTSSSSGSSSYLIGGEVVGHKTYKSDFWWCNFDGDVGQRFALGAPEFRCKLIEYSIVSGNKYVLIKNDDFRVTAAFGYERRYTFLSDRHHGLLVNIPIVFSDSYHSFCLWYMENNLRTCLSKSCGLYEYWANAYFCGARYGEMCSSLAECFNSWIEKERHLPITAMLDGIRMKMMKMASARRMECKNWKSYLCPKIEAKLLERTERARSVTVTKSDDHVFEVDTEKHKHRVDLLRRDCTCNKWGIDGFPCRHAIASIHCKQNRNEICLDGSDKVQILPPYVKKPPGRPQVKRIESAGAMRYTAHKCRKCDSTDRHDRKNCQGKTVDVLTTE
ncbi:hypothetical protein IFM89_020321 [Coptis chinensis]|uniref:SWIM-type domain-containing protein n=1 Tax=Coptis chinensis TaxID=261450 RepID=A0A835LW12_9MAGN|nr:hypothetical protein IFM89_020321 [Coptis chinensis]